MSTIDDTDEADKPGPKYLTLAARLEERIAELRTNDALPPERALMQHYDVSRTTVRRTLELLTTRGLVYQVQGSGTYVADPEVVTKTLQLTSFSEDMRRRGLEPASRILSWEQAAADPETARRLSSEPGTPVVAIHRLRLADEVPMALERVHLLAAAMDWSRVDRDRSLYAQMDEQGIRVVRATQSVHAINLDADQARLLDQAVGAAALRVERVACDERGTRLEAAMTVYRGDRYGFDFVVDRQTL